MKVMFTPNFVFLSYRVSSESNSITSLVCKDNILETPPGEEHFLCSAPPSESPCDFAPSWRMMEYQRLWVLEDRSLYFTHLKIDLPDTKSSVYMQKSTYGTSTSIQILLTLPLISQIRLQLSLVQLLEWGIYNCMQICEINKQKTTNKIILL